MVITVQTASQRLQLSVPVGCTVVQLRSLVAEVAGLSAATTKLVHAGRVLSDQDQETCKVSAGATLLALAAPPAAPSLRASAAQEHRLSDAAPVETRARRPVRPRNDDEEDDDALEDLRLARVSPALARVGRHMMACGLPEPLVVFLLPSRTWAAVAGWCLASRVASRVELGPPFVLCSMIALMLCNLSSRRRREGEWSAYSIFNKGHRAIPGSLDAAQVNAAGMMMHMQ